MALIGIAAKLIVLGHPNAHSVGIETGMFLSCNSYNFSAHTYCTDEDCRELVVWLEGSCVRALSIDERQPLLQTTSSTWNAAFANYLVACGCPLLGSAAELNNTPIRACVVWLVGHAIAMLFEDKSTKQSPPWLRSLSHDVFSACRCRDE